MLCDIALKQIFNYLPLSWKSKRPVYPAFFLIISTQKKTELALCLSIRVPQVSKVRFSSAPWMVSLHPWWVVKLSFFTGSLQRFLPGGSPSDFPHIPVCSCSCVSCRSVFAIITKREILSTKKVKKSAFF